MNKQIYIGNTPLIDLSGYATEQYVQTAVDNVDVTDQLQNYVLKTALDTSIAAVDASLVAADASITAMKSTLADIVSDGSTDAVINTWAEMKAFLADYTTASDLSTLINTVKEQAVEDASADAAGKYQPIGSYLTADDVYQKPEINNQVQILTSAISQVNDAVASKTDASAVSAQINSSIAALDLPNTYQPKGSYLVADDISTFVDAAAVAGQINSSIAALDLANTYQAKGDYLVADDISTFITGDDISTFVDADTIAATYETKNDASNHVEGAGVMHIVKCTSTEYAALDTKDATTLYIVTD